MAGDVAAGAGRRRRLGAVTTRPVRPGDKYGRLTVNWVERGSSRVAPTAHCTCDCGNSHKVRPSNLRRGRSTSCARCRHTRAQETRHVFHPGDTFGTLTVIGDKRGGRSRLLVCQCVCGAIETISAKTLRRRVGKSCQHGLPDEHGTALRDLMRRYRRSAAKRGLLFTLTEQEFTQIIAQPCYYCGAPPSGKHYSDWKRKRYALIFTGIDRADSAFDYTVENSRPCCTVCNYAKGTMSAPEYVDHCRRVVGWSLFAPRSVFD